MARLVDLEHLHAYRLTPTGAFVYELAYDGDPADSRRFLTGLVDPTTLDSGDDSPSKTCRSGPEAGRSGSGRPPGGDQSALGHSSSNGTEPQANSHEPAPGADNDPNRTAPGDGHDAVVVAAAMASLRLIRDRPDARFSTVEVVSVESDFKLDPEHDLRDYWGLK